MGPLKLAEARSRGYGLLGQVILRGLTPTLLIRIQQTPLASLLSAEPDLDALAAEHHQLLSMDIHPYASLFLTPDPGGCIAPIRDACRSAGFHIDTASARPDHLGIALMLLSFLCGARADALADDRPQIAAQTEALAQSYLASHLTPWIAPLNVAVSAHDQGFWAAIIGTACDLAMDHWDGSGTLTLPEAPALLSESKTGLRAIATYLLSPCHSGLYLSRADIGRLSRGVSVPRGFGSREMELTNLLRTAAEYGEIGTLMEQLDTLLAARSAATSGPHEQVWRSRIVQTQGMVREIRSEAVERPVA